MSFDLLFFAVVNTALKFMPVVAVTLVFVLFYCRNTFDPKSVRGKRVIITGSSSGIGEAVAYQYSKWGAQLVIAARREEMLQKVASNCKELGAAKVEYVVADMSNEEDRRKLVCTAEKELGGLDHLILNHAFEHATEWLGTPEEMESLRKILDTNIYAYVDIASKCLPMLLASKGSIGISSSISGKIGTAYIASHSLWKAALQGFFSAFRQELRAKETGVSVTFGVFGYIATGLPAEAYGNNLSNQSVLQTGIPTEAALILIKGVVKRSYEVYYPNDVFYYLFLSRFMPNYIEDYLGSGFHKIANGL